MSGQIIENEPVPHWRDRWRTDSDGVFHIGAPAHGGSMELKDTSMTVEGKDKNFVRFEIKRYTESEMSFEHFSLPVDQIPELIAHLQRRVTGGQ